LAFDPSRYISVPDASIKIVLEGRQPVRGSATNFWHCDSVGPEHSRWDGDLDNCRKVDADS
jgi:hypothetical protein